MLCAGFAAIGVSQTVTGALGASGCTSPDGAPYEAYSLNSFGAGTLTVRGDGGGFHAAGDRADERRRGDRLPRPQSSMPPCRYEIVVYGEGGSGRYEITTSFEPSLEETCRELKRISEPGIEPGTVDALNSCADTESPKPTTSRTSNYYSLTVPAAGIAEIAGIERRLHARR
jgi:hypothetical protein